MKTIRTLAFLAAALLVVATGVPSSAQYAPSGGSNQSRVAGHFVASNYNYPPTNNYVVNGNSATGTATITLQIASIKLPDGRQILPYNIFTPILVGGPSNQEYLLPTGVSNCYYNSSTGNGQCQVTGSFSNTHGFGEPVVSGTAGMAEAVYDAFLAGGGIVVSDKAWEGGVNLSCTNCYASVSALLNGLVVFPTVTIERDGPYGVGSWGPAPANDTFLAVPATLTATTVGFGLNGANTTGGTYTGTSTYHACVSYVDIMGNEGPCSLDFSSLTAGTGSTNQIGVAAPVASAGAIGYTVYISLASGSYAFAYQVPLTTGVCTLTTFESVTPACAVANTAYGQSGSNAIVSALTVNTSPLALQLGAASTTSDYVGNSNGHTVYAYVPGSHVALGGIVGASMPFTAGPATVATTVPQVVGTLALPANFMDYVGKTIRLCGKMTLTENATPDTIQKLQAWWDGAGSDAAGVPVLLGTIFVPVTTSTAAAYNEPWCFDLTTTVQGTSVTAGSILISDGWMTNFLASAGTAEGYGGDSNTGTAVGSLNLAAGLGFSSRLHIVQLHTGGTDVSPQLLSLSVEVLN
jgi:hypothetical protein